MTGPTSPQRVLADQLAGSLEERMRVAGDQLAALEEAGYAVVSKLDPDGMMLAGRLPMSWEK